MISKPSRAIETKKAYMYVKPAKVLGELLLPLCTDILKVLIAEDDYAPLCNEQGKFVLLRIRKLRELDSTDLSTDTRCQTGQ